MALWPRASAGQAGGRHGSPWRAAGVALVAVTAMSGVGLVRASVTETPPPPQPAVEAAPDPTSAPSKVVPAHLARSAPTDITISRIGVRAKIMNLGVNADNTLQVPPLKKATLAGWYSLGPSPGELGNAVIVGHVSTAELGPTVFFKLGSLRKKDVITIKRKDGSNARFRVDGVKAYPKKTFPTDLVYGPNSNPGLRLVTCGGKFDAKAHSYVDNVIVFATAF